MAGLKLAQGGGVMAFKTELFGPERGRARALGDQMAIFVGGQTARQYASIMERAAAEHIPSLEALSTRLATLNATPAT